VVAPGSVPDSGNPTFDQLVLLDLFELHEVVEVFAQNRHVLAIGIEEVLGGLRDRGAETLDVVFKATDDLEQFE
jgi:hypothetical protein